MFSSSNIEFGMKLPSFAPMVKKVLTSVKGAKAFTRHKKVQRRECSSIANIAILLCISIEHLKEICNKLRNLFG